MREICLDTETTGLDPNSGHRVVEIACVELENLVPTGREFHCYCNPERDMPEEAFNVHGLSEAFLADKPRFADHADAFLDFIGNDRVVAHNADFDLRFLRAELKRAGITALTNESVDTVHIARRKFPGSPASLDALCRRFEIDLSGRAKHGALIDTRLLARVYLELMGGREPGLALAAKSAIVTNTSTVTLTIRPARPHAPSAEELAAHAAHLGLLKNPLWLAE